MKRTRYEVLRGLYFDPAIDVDPAQSIPEIHNLRQAPTLVNKGLIKRWKTHEVPVGDVYVGAKCYPSTVYDNYRHQGCRRYRCPDDCTR